MHSRGYRVGLLEETSARSLIEKKGDASKAESQRFATPVFLNGYLKFEPRLARAVLSSLHWSAHVTVELGPVQSAQARPQAAASNDCRK